MKKALSLVLEDDELIDLIRILMDDDADGALVFLKTHQRQSARSAGRRLKSDD
jgi:hypothetical protein